MDVAVLAKRRLVDLHPPARPLRAQLDSGMRFVHGYAQPRSIPVEAQYQSFVRYYEFAKPYSKNPQFLRVGITGDGNSIANTVTAWPTTDLFPSVGIPAFN